MKFDHTLRCLPVLIVLLALPVHGEILLQESFADYEPGPAAGQEAVGAGLSGDWTGRDRGAVIQSESLEHAAVAAEGGSLKVSGGGVSLNVPIDTSTDGPFAAYLDADNQIGGSGREFYISFLGKLDSTEVEGALAAIMFNAAPETPNGIFIGQVWERDNFSLGDGEASEVKIDTEVHHFLAHVQFEADRAVVELYVDPDLDRPLDGQVVASRGWPRLTGFSNIEIKSLKNDWSVDEIWIATDLGSLTKP